MSQMWTCLCLILDLNHNIVYTKKYTQVESAYVQPRETH